MQSKNVFSNNRAVVKQPIFDRNVIAFETASSASRAAKKNMMPLLMWSTSVCTRTSQYDGCLCHTRYQKKLCTWHTVAGTSTSCKNVLQGLFSSRNLPRRAILVEGCHEKIRRFGRYDLFPDSYILGRNRFYFYNKGRIIGKNKVSMIAFLTFL